MFRPAPLLLALIATTTMGAAPPGETDGRSTAATAGADHSLPQSGDLSGLLLALHNRERARVGVTPLEWDAGLARSAAEHGAELVRSGQITPSPLETRPLQGENLWVGRHGAHSLDQAVAGWAAEKSLFRPGRFPDVSTTGRWRDVAHYTQMIWPGTSRVGCAVVRGSAQDVLVCYYAPGGNVVGHLML